MSDSIYLQIAVWSQVVSAVLFMGVLVWLWFKFIQPAILAAQARYNKQVAEAERHRDEAKAMLDLLRNDVDGARHDAELITSRADGQATREYEAILAETRDAGERGVQGAQGEFARSLASARDRLRVELLDKALRQARDETSRRVDAALDAQLVDRFAASLERSNG